MTTSICQDSSEPGILTDFQMQIEGNWEKTGLHSWAETTSVAPMFSSVLIYTRYMFLGFFCSLEFLQQVAVAGWGSKQQTIIIIKCKSILPPEQLRSFILLTETTCSPPCHSPCHWVHVTLHLNTLSEILRLFFLAALYTKWRFNIPRIWEANKISHSCYCNSN